MLEERWFFQLKVHSFIGTLRFRKKIVFFRKMDFLLPDGERVVFVSYVYPSGSFSQRRSEKIFFRSISIKIVIIGIITEKIDFRRYSTKKSLDVIL